MKLKTEPDKDFPGGILGSGTKLEAEQGHIILDAHEDDMVFLTESNGCVTVTVNGTVVELNDFESRNIVIRSNPAHVVADNTVTIPVKGLFQRPPDHPKSTAQSAGLVFRGLYRKWQLNKLFGPKK